MSLKISQKKAKLLTKIQNFAGRAVNVAKLSHIFGRFRAPYLCRPWRSRGNGAYVTPLLIV